jgi:RHS repeat-associated protein
VLAEVVEGPEQPEGEQGETWVLRMQVEFDPMGRLTQRRGQVWGQAAQVERFAYGANGQLVQADNRAAKLQWFRDAAGNVVREHHHYLGLKQTAVWHHGYDELNQRVSTLRPDGHRVGWLTYGSGHVHGLVLDGEEVVGFERDALHREVQRTQGNGLAQRQRFDPMGRLAEQSVVSRLHEGPIQMDSGVLTHKGIHSTQIGMGRAAAVMRTYHYDPAGQLTGLSDSRRGRLNYRYDPVGQLLEAQSGMRERFAFDPAGNIREALKEDDTVRRVTDNPVLDNLLKEYAGTRYRYDERGNLIERVHQGLSATYEWDAFNRMTAARTWRGTTSFAYDPLGRRIEKTHQATVHVDLAATLSRTLFGWDGDTLAFESTRKESTADPSRVRREEQTVHYIHEKDSFVPLLQARRAGAIQLKPTTDVKALMAANEGKYDIRQDPLWSNEYEEPEPFQPREVVFYQCDHLGTPQEMTDHAGTVAWAARYKAWGQAEEAVSEAARKAGVRNPIRFQGQYLDEETGLHYNRHRYYDPHSGRFVSKDPIGLNGGNNLHQYAPNPIEWIDPLGLARHFKTQDEAAIHALKEINPTSIKEDKEYGGLIYKNRGKTYSHTPAYKGSVDGVDVMQAFEDCPKNSKIVASYHTHGGFNKNYSSEEFSDEDIINAHSRKIDNYVGTPKGKFGKYDVKTKKSIYIENALPTK